MREEQPSLRPIMPGELKKTMATLVPVMWQPGMRTRLAVQNGVEKNILIKTWGGLGDQICAEPTLRHAVNCKYFQDCKLTLASEYPELFRHLNFHEVFNLKKSMPVEDNYLVFETIQAPGQSLVWDFVNHMLTNCVDFPSICAFRMQLPNVDKEITLKPLVDGDKMHGLLKGESKIVVHPGRHWQSKTFPKDWWDAVLKTLIDAGFAPIIIGGDTDDNRGTVDVDARGCIDLRNKLLVQESIWLLQNSKVLLTNDSAPLHMAVSGDAWIGFVATCKRADYITHWRHGQWGWRMQNFGKGGMWDVLTYIPNTMDEVTVDKVPEELLRSWLPFATEFAAWAVEKACAG